MGSDCRGGDIHGSMDMAMGMRVMGKQDMERGIRKVIENRLRNICGYLKTLLRYNWLWTIIRCAKDVLEHTSFLQGAITDICYLEAIYADWIVAFAPRPQNVVDASYKSLSVIP